jgi:hypothetical protein
VRFVQSKPWERGMTGFSKIIHRDWVRTLNLLLMITKLPCMWPQVPY